MYIYIYIYLQVWAQSVWLKVFGSNCMGSKCLAQDVGSKSHRGFPVLLKHVGSRMFLAFVFNVFTLQATVAAPTHPSLANKSWHPQASQHSPAHSVQAPKSQQQHECNPRQQPQTPTRHSASLPSKRRERCLLASHPASTQSHSCGKSQCELQPLTTTTSQ